MSTTPDILKLRVLLSFLKEDETCTVTGISKTLGETKQTISRIIIAMEEEGLIDRSNTRQPVLTDKGKNKAAIYTERIRLSLNHLIREGVNIESAKNDAYHWALYNTDETMEVISRLEEQYRIKHLFKDEFKFNGSTLCKKMHDGEYSFPFTIYREHIHDGDNISMANSGFEHPCVLSVKNGVGTIQLKAVNIIGNSAYTGKIMKGMIKSLKYFESGNYIGAERSGNIFSIPASAVRFINMGEGIGQTLHGTASLKMQCSAGILHMPESGAIFAMLI